MKKKNKANKAKYSTCSKCGKLLTALPFVCSKCNKSFCSNHRIPESHRCDGVISDRNNTSNIKNWSSSHEKYEEEREFIESKDSKKEHNFQRPSPPDFKRIYSRYVKPNFKFIPVITIALLLFFWITTLELDKPSDGDNTGQVTKFEEILFSFFDSFDFSNPTQIMMTVLLMISIVGGYIYWLKRIWVVRRNNKLMEILLFSLILLVFYVHIKPESALGIYYEWIISLSLFVFVVGGTLMLMKSIDRIDMRSDLKCWGIRIIGFFIGLYGILLFMSGGVVLVMAKESLMVNYLGIIVGLCLIALGSFCMFRSFRRYGFFVYHGNM